jgi:hypothetical protein
MNKLQDINLKTIKIFNTLYLFEFIFNNELLNIKNIESEEFINEEINIDLIYEIFDEIWKFSNKYDKDAKLLEKMIYDVAYDSNTFNEHKELIYFCLINNIDITFEVDNQILEKIKDYIVNITHEYGNKIKIRYLIKNYNMFIKQAFINNYKYEILLCKENFCLN